LLDVYRLISIALLFSSELLMPSPPDAVSEGIMFLSCPSAAYIVSFVRLSSQISNLGET